MTHATNKARTRRAQQLADAANGIGAPALVLSVQDRRAQIWELQSFARRRRQAMKTQQKIDRALESFVRREFTKWDPQNVEQTEAERDTYNKEVRRLIDAAAEGTGDPVLIEFVRLTNESRAVWDRMRESTEGRMEAIARGLHVAPWIGDVHGIGLLGLALIIAEAGTLDTYPNPQRVWSRLGFAPYDGLAGSTWKRPKWRTRALTDEEWTAHPFSGSRYAPMFVLATWLVNHQWISAAKSGTDDGKPNGRYGEVYAARRIRTQVTHPDWTDGHRRKDGLRVAFKQFLVDLWEQWIDRAFDLGPERVDAQPPHAESAAVGQRPIDAHTASASGGPKSPKRRGPRNTAAPRKIAASAAAGPNSHEAQTPTAGGGTRSKRARRSTQDARPRA